MTAVMVVVVLLVVGAIAYLIWKTSEPSTPESVDPEQAMKAAVELHRIRRNLDVAWIKSEQRRESTALRRDIAEALEDEDD